MLPSNYFEGGDFIEFTDADSIIKIDKNGQITTNIPNTIQMTPNAKLFIFQPDNPAFLKKTGDNLYVYENESRYIPLEESGACHHL